MQELLGTNETWKLADFNEKQELQALKAGKGNENIRRQQRLGKHSMSTKKEEDETTSIIQNLDSVIKSSTRNCGAPEDQTLKIMTTPPQTMTSSKTLQNVLVDEIERLSER